MGVPVGVGVRVFVGVLVDVLVGVEVGVLVGVSVGVLVRVIEGVKVGVFVTVAVIVTVNCDELFGVIVTRMTLTILGVSMRIGVSVGDTETLGNEVAVATGAGTKAIPAAPIITSANPLTALIINSLGYFICINES